MGKNVFKSLCWVGYYLVVQVIATIAFMIYYITSGKFSFNLETSDSDVLANEIINFIMQITVPTLIATALVVIGTFLLYILIRKHPLNFNQTKAREVICFSAAGITLNAGITVVLMLIQGILESLLSFLGDMSGVSTTDMVLTGQPFWMLLLGTGILVPIMEEIVFRYGMCGTLARKGNKMMALVVSSLIFGVMHGNLIQGGYATVLGFIMGLVYLKYDNLLYPIIIHMSINSSSVIISEFANEWYLLGAGAIAATLLITMLKQYPDLKDFSFIKEKREIKVLPSLKDIKAEKMEEVYEETHDIEKESD